MERFWEEDFSCVSLISYRLRQKLFGWVSSSQQFVDPLGTVSPSFATVTADA
jgi:hypothetical protein